MHFWVAISVGLFIFCYLKPFYQMNVCSVVLTSSEVVSRYLLQG